MITAQEAFKKVTDGQTQNAQKEMDQIEKIIEAAIQKNELSCVWSGSICGANKRILEEAGYKVTTGGRFNEIDTCISWDLK